MEEIWKEIKGYPNYQVSNMGRVKSLGKSKTAYGFMNNLRENPPLKWRDESRIS